MTTYNARVTTITVTADEKPTFDERSTVIRIEDEGGGEFVTLEQSGGKLCFDPDEWPTIRAAVDTLVADIEAMERKQAKEGGAWCNNR